MHHLGGVSPQYGYTTVHFTLAASEETMKKENKENSRNRRELPEQ